MTVGIPVFGLLSHSSSKGPSLTISVARCQVPLGEYAIVYLLADGIALVQGHDQHLLDRELISMLAGGGLGPHPP